MPGILDLPYELIATILGSFDNVHDLPSCLLVCRHFYTSFHETPSVAATVLRRQIRPFLLSYSIAIFRTIKLAYPQPTAHAQLFFDQLYDDPDQLASQVTTLATPDIIGLGRLHETIQSLAIDYLGDAWRRLGLDETPIDISPGELLRTCRAFYQAELGFRTFRSDEELELSLDGEDLLIKRNPPWINEQITCVHDFLEKKFTDAALDVLAHDVEFGEREVDYLTNGGDNYPKQQWLTKGVIWIHRFIYSDSYDTKHKMLQWQGYMPQGYLREILSVPFEAPREDLYEPYSIYMQDTGHSSGSHPATGEIGMEGEDWDWGPVEAWAAFHQNTHPVLWSASEENWGRRLSAYVFWDSDRIKRFNLLSKLENQQDSPEPSSEAKQTMRDSFEERTKIWKRGGRGYWDWNDLSRVTGIKYADNS